MKFKSYIQKNQNSIGLLIFSFLASGVFIFLGSPGHTLGFPLDDAWIHQTYARNLITLGSWSYTAGAISGGSTSPLWTMLTSFGYTVSNSFGIVWTFLLAMIAFGILVSLSAKITNQIGNFRNKWLVVIPGIALALEWHLLWATGSGMETILFSLGIICLFSELLQDKLRWWVIGLISGLLIWVRPDGITFLGPIVIVFLLDLLHKKNSLKDLLVFLLPYLITIGSYFIFNYLLTGSIFPNTFYAKQREYISILNSPIFSRIFGLISPLITGSGIIILPGFLFEIWHLLRTKNIKLLTFVIWIIGFILLYAVRLPVTYQHGRYIFPVIAPFFILGIAGYYALLNQLKSIRVRKLIQVAWISSLMLISAAFYWIGINAYRSDLIIIDQLMVQPAKWVDKNLKNEDIIAVHDIGAIGYFTKNQLIDLAGLINPQVIPFMNDEEQLQEYIKGSKANYFIGFSTWYPTSSTWGIQIKSFEGIYQGVKETVVILKLK